jgi:hypothetical protein
MKGIDKLIFWTIIVMSSVIGFFVFDSNFEAYSEMITFLSIMIGFEIASLAILFNSPLKKALYDNNKTKPYKTELHRLRDYYKHAIYFEVFSVILIFFIPNSISFQVFGLQVYFGKHVIVAPIILGSVFCFHKICNDLFRIFTYPTNN